jgi:hypothetical protein
MTKHPRDVNPDLVKQEIEKGRMGDRELAKKPGEAPRPRDGTESEGVTWDDDQQALIENQDMSEIERLRRKDEA